MDMLSHPHAHDLNDRRDRRSVRCNLEPLEGRRLLAGTPQGGEFLVNQTTQRDQFAPAVARDYVGNFVVVWASEGADPANDTDVYARRYDFAGNPLGGEFRVNTFTTGIQSRPTVAMDSDGDFVVAWQSGTANPQTFGGQDGSGSGIYAQRYNSSGAAQGGEFRVNATTANDQDAPSVAMDYNGNFVVAWNSFGQDGSEYGVYAQRYNAAGAVQGGEFRANTFTAGNQSDPRVDMNRVGDFVIVWGSDAQDGAGRGVFGQFYNAGGATSGGEFRVNTVVANNQNRPAVAMDANGNFVVAYQDGSTIPNVPGQDGSGYGVYARRYVTQDRIPPTVARATFNFLTSQNVQVTFTQNVGASLTPADVQLQNLTTGQTIPAGSMAVTFDASTNTATLTFPGFANGTLPDGNYRLTLFAPGITNSAGQQLDADRNGTGGDNFTFDFFALTGDANRDKRVNLQDFNTLAANFGQSPRNFSQGDFNYDGFVNLQDFNLLASRFGTVLAAPAAATTSDRSGASRVADDVLT